MGTFTRPIGLIVASAGIATALAVTGAPSALGANQALFLNGLAAGELTPIVMSNILHGAFIGDTRSAVSWPAQAKPFTGKDSLSLGESVDIGVANLTTATNTALGAIAPGEKVTIVGLSAGSLVSDQYMRNLLAAGDAAPDKSQLSFVVVADGNRVWLNRDRYDKILKYNFQAPPVTKYDTVVVTGEYDGFADFPDRPWNVVADLNAVAGTIVVHIPVMFADLSKVPAANIKSTTNALGGVTTNYLVPTETLPLVQLFPFLKSQEAALKKIVDAGYKRNDPINGVSGAASTVTVASTSPAASAVAADPAPAVQVDAPAPAGKAAKVVAAAKAAVAKAFKGPRAGEKPNVNRRANADAPKPAAATRKAANAS